MHFTILGFGTEGKSTYKYLHKKYPQANIEIRDKKTMNIPSNTNGVFGDHYLENIVKDSHVYRSPSILPEKITQSNLVQKTYTITSQTIEFFQHCPCPIIGVTGTKGKGTTCRLIYEILKAAGKSVHILGNIGIPALDILNHIHKDDIVIYELSSFQLIDLRTSPHIAVVLNINEDHLDIHRDIEEYHYAKSHIVRHQTSNDYAIINNMYPISRGFYALTSAQKYSINTTKIHNVIPLDKKTNIDVRAIKLKGRHHLENIMAAITVAKILNISTNIIKTSILSFTGLKHRMQWCGNINGIDYYNDSAGTNPETAIAALRACKGKGLSLFLGGSRKNNSYENLIEVMAESNIINVILIPETGSSIWDLFQNRYPKKAEGIHIHYYQDMNTALDFATQNLKDNDIVLLSPGSASFGVFQNYKDRGDQFIDAIKQRTT